MITVCTRELSCEKAWFEYRPLLIIVASFSTWSVLHYTLGARTLREDVDRAEA